MNPSLLAIADRQGGPFTRAQAIASGIGDDQLRHLTRAGTLRRLRRGAYVETVRLAKLSDVDRHLVQVRAVALSLQLRVAFSHSSAAVLHGLALWNVDLSDVHVTRLDDGAARNLAGVRHHVGFLDEDDLVTVDNLTTVRPARAVAEVAMCAGFEAGVVAADSALHHGRTTRDELAAVFEEVRQWPGATCVGSVIAHANGLSESVGETRARMLFVRQSLPLPSLQRTIFDPAGTFVARVDFLFTGQRTVAEFDGRVKYRGTSQVSSDVVVAEKTREDRLRELGYQVVRLTWADLDRPEWTTGRLRAAFTRSLTS